MPSKQREFIIQVNQLGDGLLIAIVFWFAHALREQLAYAFPFHYRFLGCPIQFGMIAPFRYYKWLYLVILPLYPFLLDVNGFYTRSHTLRRRNTVWILIKSCAICLLAVGTALYIFRLAMLSRWVVSMFALFSLVALYAKDRIFQAHMTRRARSGKEVTEIILVGSEERNAEFAKLLEEHPEWSLRVTAKLDPNGNLLTELPMLLHCYPVGCVIFSVTQTAFSEIEIGRAHV